MLDFAGQNTKDARIKCTKLAALFLIPTLFLAACKSESSESDYLQTKIVKPNEDGLPYIKFRQGHTGLYFNMNSSTAKATFHFLRLCNGFEWADVSGKLQSSFPPDHMKNNDDGSFEYTYSQSVSSGWHFYNDADNMYKKELTVCGVEAAVTIQEGDGFVGIFCPYESDESGYRFGIDSQGGWEFLYLDAEGWHPVKSGKSGTSSALKTGYGQTNTLLVCYDFARNGIVCKANGSEIVFLPSAESKIQIKIEEPDK